MYAWLELRRVLLACRILGISHAVRYLRNPNVRVIVPLLRAFGATIGEKSRFKGSLFIDNAFEDENSAGDFSHLRIGHNCYIGDGVYFDLASRVILEDNVVISAQVAFLTHSDCNRSPELAVKYPRSCEPVTLRTGAWIGARALLMPGVTIGTASVIAAGALLRTEAGPHAVYAGVPARKVYGTSDATPASGQTTRLRVGSSVSHANKLY